MDQYTNQSSPIRAQMSRSYSPAYLASWQQPLPSHVASHSSTYVQTLPYYGSDPMSHLAFHALPTPVYYPSAQAYSQNQYLPYYAGQVAPNAQHYAAQQAQLQSQQAQQRNAVLEHQSAQRRAKKPTDRNMPDGIEDMVIGDGVQQYKDLREMERRLDYTMQRKRLDLQETFSRNNKRPRTLRVWISNTANNQPWQRGALEQDAFDFQTTGDSTVRVKVEGRLLEDDDDDILLSDDDDDETQSKKETTKPPLQKMSNFFKNMTVEFDKNKNNVPDPGWQVEWKKQANAKDIDMIHFQRKLDENINVTINFTRDEQPERYRLSHVLQSTLDMEEGDRAEVVMAIWEYIKCFNLQEDEDKRAIRCDDQLRQVSKIVHVGFAC